MFYARFLLFCVVGAIMAGCDSEKKDKDQSQPVLDIMITGEEGQDSLSVLLQVQYEDESEGGKLPTETLALVEDQDLELDSAGVTGYFYSGRVPFPRDSFVVFKIVSSGKTVFSQNHDVRRPGVEPPSSFTKEGLTLLTEGERSRFRVAIVDTAYLSNDVSGIYMSSGTELKIPSADLAPLTPGPVFLTITWEKRKRLENDRFGGEIISKYSIYRESLLQ